MLTTIAAIAIAFACLCVLGGMSVAARHDRADEQRERTARKLAIVREEQRSPRVVERNLERRLRDEMRIEDDEGVSSANQCERKL